MAQVFGWLLLHSISFAAEPETEPLPPLHLGISAIEEDRWYTLSELEIVAMDR